MKTFLNFLSPDNIVEILNHALATEIVCVLRYRRHYYTAPSGDAKKEFLQHANQEFEHMDWLAQRIKELGGKPNFNPNGIEVRSNADYDDSSNLKSMIEADLEAEEIAISHYTEAINRIGLGDKTTKELLEKILKVEKEHAKDMEKLLES